MRSLAAGGAALGLVLVLPLAAAAHSFGGWDGSSGPMSWEAKRLSCGVVGEKRSRVRSHTRWRTAPPSGYQRMTFIRQVRSPDDGSWTTVHQQRRSTKGTELKGSRLVVHWRQWFQPFPGEAGLTSRHRVVFEWLRGRPGADLLRLRRVLRLGSCVVGG